MIPAIIAGVVSMLCNSNSSDGGLSAGIKSALNQYGSNNSKNDSDTNGTALKSISNIFG